MDHTPNPDCLKFTPSDPTREVDMMDEGVILDISSRDEVHQSPLAERIFEVSGVEGVCLGDYWLTVTKEEDREWEELSPPIIEAITKWAESGDSITSESYVEHDDTEIAEDFDTEVVQAIKELVRTRIRPGVQQDGGNIRYIGFEDGVVMLLMQGACQSCPSSGATLKGGIEKMMMHWIPEVVEVCFHFEEKNFGIFWWSFLGGNETTLPFLFIGHCKYPNRSAVLKTTLQRNMRKK